MAKAVKMYGAGTQFLTNDGIVASGGLLFQYQSGTTTKANTYTTSIKNTNNSNPLSLSSSGRLANDVWIDQSMKFVLAPSTDSDPPASAYWTNDNNTSTQELWSVTSKSTDYTILETDREKLIKVDASAGNKTITLIAAATAGDGFRIAIKKSDSSANTVTIDGNSSETIDDATTVVLDSQYDTAVLISDGTNWQNMSAFNQGAQTFYDTNNNEILEFITTASAVNNIGLVNAATGNNPRIRARGEADTGITFDNSEAEEILVLDSIASSVNEVTVSSAATGNKPTIAATGDDTNVGIVLKGKGTGSVVLGQATSTGVQLAADQALLDSNGNEYFKFSAAASAVNEFTVVNGATGIASVLKATGGDTNISLDLQAKGSGLFRFISGGSGTPGASLFLFQKANDYGIMLSAPGSGLSSNVSFTLPSADGTTGQVIKTNGSGTLSFVDQASSSFQFISTQTASASSSINFTDLSTSYNAYLIVLNGVRPATDNVDLLVRFSTDNGSTYATTSYSYALTSSSATVANQSGGTGQSSITIGTGMGNAGGSLESGDFIVHLTGNNAVAAPGLNSQGIIMNPSTAPLVQNCAGYRMVSGGINAIRFVMGSGNIAAGRFSLYGIKTS
jgi:hypothetical protein